MKAGAALLNYSAPKAAGALACRAHELAAAAPGWAGDPSATAEEAAMGEFIFAVRSVDAGSPSGGVQTGVKSLAARL